MKVSILGTGYVGLVSGACLAELGHDVICVDVDPAKVDALNSATAPIHEQGLPELLQKHVPHRLRATTETEKAVLETELTLIAVPTPFNGETGFIDLTFIEAAARQIGAALAKKSSYHVVAVKSTVVPGTTEEMMLPTLEQASGKRAGEDFGVGMNPEFLSEGVAVGDFLQPDRIVIGGIDLRTLDLLEALHKPLAHVPMVRTNTRTAELIKYSSNALLATAISFANEIGDLCAATGDVDVVDVMKGLHLCRYLNVEAGQGRVEAPISRFLEAGCGYGGSCLPKDVSAIVAHGHHRGVPMRLLDSVQRINNDRPAQVVKLLRTHFPETRGVKVAVLGTAFKPDTDDIRLSPALPIIDELLTAGVDVRTYDPAANDNTRKYAGDRFTVCDSLGEAIIDADAIVLATRWDQFRVLPTLLRQLDRQPLVIDGRRMLSPESVERYEGIGRSLGREKVEL